MRTRAKDNTRQKNILRTTKRSSWALLPFCALIAFLFTSLLHLLGSGFVNIANVLLLSALPYDETSQGSMLVPGQAGPVHVAQNWLLYAEPLVGSSPMYRRSLAYAYMTAGDWESAEEALTKALRAITSEWAFLYLRLGDVLYARGNTDQAVEAWIHSRAAELFFARGLHYRGERDLDQAILNFDLAVQIEPAESEYRLFLAGAYLAVDRANEAIEHAQAVLEMQDKKWQGGACWQLGRAYIQQEQYDIAIANLERAVRLQPDNVFFRLYLGDAYLHAGRVDEARTQYEHGLQLDPDSAAAVERLKSLEAILADS